MKKRIITTIIAITIIMTTLFMLASVNTSALVVAYETPVPTAVVVWDETPAPTVNAAVTVTPTPTPTPIADPIYPFTIKQKILYPKKMKITGTLSQNEPPTPTTMVVSVNGIEILRKELPLGKTYSMIVDFSAYNIGDSVVFDRVASDGSFSLSMLRIFKIKKQPAKSSKKSKAIKLNKKKITLKVGKKVKLKLKGAKKSKVKWSCNKKKIARVRKGVVKAKKPGKCKVVAKYLGKKYKCVVNVIKRSKNVDKKDVVISLKWTDKTYNSVELTVSNNSKESIMTGYGGRTLKKFTDGQWVYVPMLETAPAVPDLAVIIKPKQEWSQFFSIKECFGELSAGEYILSKSVHANGKELSPSIRFTVPSSVPATTSAPTSTPVATPTPDVPALTPGPDIMAGAVNVQIKVDMTEETFKETFSEIGIRDVDEFNMPVIGVQNLFHVYLLEETMESVNEAIEFFSASELVEYAKPIYLAYPC